MRAARVRAVTDSLHADRIAILVPLTVGLSAFAAAIVAVAISFALAAHLVEIGVWALLFMICGESLEFATAFDHSAVDYTTLGYGNVVMSPSWRLLGPLEAANGMPMFGVSTAMLFAVILRLLHARLSDLKD